MATGTGKTYTAFQIIHRLKTSGAKKKILFLADRNVLVDQPMMQDFKPFKDKMVKVSNKSSTVLMKSILHFINSLTVKPITNCLSSSNPLSLILL